MYGIRESSPSSGYESESGRSTSTAPGDEENHIVSDSDGDEIKAYTLTEVGKLPLAREGESVEIGETTTATAADVKNDADSVEVMSSPSTATSSRNNNSSSSSIVPEYKQVLQNLFSLFNNSKRKYPIPMYPYVKGQSSALMMKSQSTNYTNSTNNNKSDGGCSSH